MNFVARRAVFYGRMCSAMGRNVQFYCKHFGTTFYDVAILAKKRMLEDESTYD